MAEKSEYPSNWPIEWNQFKMGNQESFRKIYDFFFDRLYWYGSKISPDSELVEDCIQELFLKLYTNRENLSETDQLEFYLLKSLKLTIYQKLRYQNRLEELSQPLDSFNLELVVETDESEGCDTERIRMVKESILSLSPAAQEILYLKFYSNLGYKEIGKMMGVQPDSVKKQVYRTIGRLKEILAEKYLEFFIMCFRA
ncbi:RNA polymerase sigma factor [Mangrovibacterium sp.]|uniref:RNA polymerase sigma factor n=1 Tax=Mangrovibacterium sp. TaxID=1961364 RepID=UPI003561E7A6